MANKTLTQTPLPKTPRVATLAKIVDEAARKAKAIVQLSSAYKDISVREAYDIQRASIGMRVERGDRVVGMKMGLTSHAKMQQVGVHSPIYGHLTQSMMLNDGDSIQMETQIHPRAEPEIAFILGRDLSGPVTSAQAMLAVEGVCAALEIIDSRYQEFKFDLCDVIADNASSSGFVLGSTVASPQDFDLGNIGMVLEINGEIKQVGSSAAILEHPANALAQLANMLAERGEHLRAGQIILAGSATAAEYVQPGDFVRLRTDGLGTVSLHVQP